MKSGLVQHREGQPKPTSSLQFKSSWRWTPVGVIVLSPQIPDQRRPDLERFMEEIRGSSLEEVRQLHRADRAGFRDRVWAYFRYRIGCGRRRFTEMAEQPGEHPGPGTTGKCVSGLTGARSPGVRAPATACQCGRNGLASIWSNAPGCG
jgi:hypothetical protein